MCFGSTVAFAFIANNGLTTLPAGTPASAVIDVIDKFISVWIRLNHTSVVRSGGRCFEFKPTMVKEWFPVLTRCCLNEPIVQQTDFDYYKHSVSHAIDILV